ncbi:MAG: hypothetical protein A4C66_07500 [Nitrospira sp. HN-bin3]|uniref:hypothetical protein n=1 Tax=Nitrospira cf. moscoviensis SBR1015 TaxID=96242 RepID=UPI000A0DEA75|nr:hypothetical protein [Nitrospira cf. moscoviensis SBR1015]OQW44689.1 MAG: hypothetical protein A4C66_07500 [Nitrospira sp. HN-bin3]
MDRNTIAAAWEYHRADDWPQFSSPHQGPLMTIDTVIGGCVVYYLDSSDGLDDQRLAILKDCLNDLEDLTSELEADCQPYFLRLHRLGNLLLDTRPSS